MGTFYVIINTGMYKYTALSQFKNEHMVHIDCTKLQASEKSFLSVLSTMIVLVMMAFFTCNVEITHASTMANLTSADGLQGSSKQFSLSKTLPITSLEILTEVQLVLKSIHDRRSIHNRIPCYPQLGH